MTPLSLKLKNFIGIKSGLGRDELDIDLQTIVGDAQLIALVGPNGMGKSTVLDNLHPYRIMPSRATAYSPGSFSYYDNIYGAEASKELDWEHDGQRYRSILLFKMTGKTKKTECYLQVKIANGWQPVHLPADGTTSDGKTETYDRCLDSILGSPELFFTSVFASQGRRSLSSYTNGEIKGLLSELLGLDHIRELGTNALQVSKSLRIRLDAMRGDIARIEGLELVVKAANNDLSSAKAGLGMQSQARFACREALVKANKKLAEIEAQAGAGREVALRRESLTAQLNSAVQSAATAKREIGSQIKDANLRITITAMNRVTEADRVNRQITGAQKQIDDNTALIGRRGEIEAAKADAPKFTEQEAAASLQTAQARKQLSAHQALIAQRGALQERLSGITRDGKTMRINCDGLKNRAKLAGEVPCHGEGIYAKCPLLKEAFDAKSKIPEAEKEITGKLSEHQQEKTKLDELSTAIEAAGNVDQIVTDAQKNLDSIWQHIRANDAVIAQATSLDQADKAIAHAKAQITEFEALLGTIAATAKQTIEEANKRIPELERQLKDAAALAKTAVDALEKELAELPAPADTTTLEAARIAVDEGDKAVAAVDYEIDALNARIATLNERIRSLTAELQQAAEIKTRATSLETEIAHWTLLSTALGNNGIIALSIDDAGPTLSSLANDLLLSCYGPRFSVSLRTQEEKASGDMKETFDIVVFDADRNDEKSVRTMSGGEKIWINECITRAIALYQGQQSGQKYETLFADESDGALDPARKQMFIAMKRKAMELGGYKHEFFISHTPELWGMADAVVDMDQFRL